MNSMVKYHFPDALTLKNNIENNPSLTYRWFDKNNPILCHFERLAALHLSNTEKTEAEVDILVRSYFKMLAVPSEVKPFSLTRFINLLEEYRAILLSTTKKTEAEVDNLVGSLFSDPVLQSNVQTLPFNSCINLQFVDEDLVNRIKKSLLACANNDQKNLCLRFQYQEKKQERISQQKIYLVHLVLVAALWDTLMPRKVFYVTSEGFSYT